jgi:two-component system, NtrC family, sensor histidine kinase KinB
MPHFYLSLRNRIRLGALGVLMLGVSLGVYAMPRILELGLAVQGVLQENYISIQAGMHMHSALRRLQVAELHGNALPALAGSRREYTHWADVENASITEVGEDELAHDLTVRGRQLFADIAISSPGSNHDWQFKLLNERIDDLIAMNQAAMFRDDERAKRLSAWLAYEFGAGLLLLATLGIGVSWTLGRSIARPLETLVGLLRDVSGRKPHPRLEPQKITELNTVAIEFNRMAEQLEYYDRINLEQLLYEKGKTEAIVESLEDGVILLDSAGSIAHINQTAALIVGIPRTACLGNSFETLATDYPQTARVWTLLKDRDTERDETSGTEVNFEVRGRERTYIAKQIQLKDMTRPIGTLLVLQDVTYLRDQDRARVNLFATLSHELRTPLTGVTLSAELLRNEDSSLNAEQRHALIERIFDESTRMKRLALSLLSISIGALPPSSMQRRRLDFSQLITEVVERFDLQAQARHVRLQARTATTAMIRGDEEKLSWVVSNLIGNALRYAPEGGAIEVTTRGDGGMVRLEVIDSGPGIPIELREQIFERFVQHQSNGYSTGAAGLGLAIVKEVVEAHGGRVFVEDSIGETGKHGTKFVVQLPADEEV